MASAVAQDDGGSTPGRWCRHPGSNWGPTAYKAVALPTELCRQFAREWIAARCRRPGTPRAGILARGGRGRGRPVPGGGGGGRASARAERSVAAAVAQDDGGSTPGRWCRHPGSNWGPTAYKAVALPTELCRQFAREWIAARCRRPGTPRAGILARGGRGRGRQGRAVDGEIGRAHV